MKTEDVFICTHTLSIHSVAVLSGSVVTVFEGIITVFLNNTAGTWSYVKKG